MSKATQEGLKLIFKYDLLVFVCFLVCLFDWFLLFVSSFGGLFCFSVFGFLVLGSPPLGGGVLFTTEYYETMLAKYLLCN